MIDEYLAQLKQAYEEGCQAGKSKATKKANPYTWLTQLWVEWNRGYNDNED